jgi:hypothetical protein
MLESVGLTHFQTALLDAITFDLANIPGVTAVVLGGSYARGTARPESDIDVALYYAESSPPEIEAIRRCAEKISIPNHPPTVAGYYKWGPWVNGDLLNSVQFGNTSNILCVLFLCVSAPLW